MARRNGFASRAAFAVKELPGQAKVEVVARLSLEVVEFECEDRSGKEGLCSPLY